MMNSWAVWSLLFPLVAALSKIGEVGGVDPLDGFPDPIVPDENSTFVPDGAMDQFCEIMLQSPVPLPPDQIPWNCICSHCQGTKGPKGDRGDRGMPGRPGSPGPRGPPGFKGPQGFVGRPGIKGQKGDDGAKGAPGLQGMMGPKGGLGFKGEKGDMGMGGPPGEMGPKGDDGVCPDPCDASQGPPGPPGVPGPVGLRGKPGADGPKGQKGGKGDSGEPGAPGTDGPPGVKGDQGPEGECPCIDGEDGAPGQKGDQGDQGPPGDAGTKGEPGQPGEKGDQGMMGMMGLPGPCMPQRRSAFSAALTNSFPSPDLPVAFTRVLYNTQKDYIPPMGIYVAPTNGTYVFSLHLTVGERVLIVGLFRNFRPVLISTDTRPLGTHSQTVVLPLLEGDGVWLQVKDSVSNGMIAEEESSSVFSGYLLYPDKCEMGGMDMGMGMGMGTGRGGSIGDLNLGTDPDTHQSTDHTESNQLKYYGITHVDWDPQP